MHPPPLPEGEGLNCSTFSRGLIVVFQLPPPPLHDIISRIDLKFLIPQILFLLMFSYVRGKKIELIFVFTIRLEIRNLKDKWKFRPSEPSTSKGGSIFLIIFFTTILKDYFHKFFFFQLNIHIDNFFKFFYVMFKVLKDVSTIFWLLARRRRNFFDLRFGLLLSKNRLPPKKKNDPQRIEALIKRGLPPQKKRTLKE